MIYTGIDMYLSVNLCNLASETGKEYLIDKLSWCIDYVYNFFERGPIFVNAGPIATF